jgi:pimeloyl-ACP methyl ester carboxylesterase
MDLTPSVDGFYKDGPLGRAWGVTRMPLNFQPAAATAKDLNLVRQAAADGPDLVRCWVQPEPARQLPNLKGIPILIVVSEASYHAPYDHCTAKFLTQASVANTFVRLPSVGIRGNGHMMMLEKNNLEIAAFLTKWAKENIR